MNIKRLDLEGYMEAFVESDDDFWISPDERERLGKEWTRIDPIINKNGVYLCGDITKSMTELG